MNETCVVVGATGDVGRVVADELRAAGGRVREVSRSHGVPLDDEAALRHAFDGAGSAFVMIPFDMAAPDLHQREDEIGRRLAAAIRSAGTRRVVLLSGLSAHLERGSAPRRSSSWGAAAMETRLDTLDLPELVHLRAGFFMENFTKGLNVAAQAESGTFSTAFRGDRPLPMVSAGDVGRVAAKILLQPAFDEPRVRELQGADDHTLAEAAAILGASLGRPGLAYAQSPYEAGHQGMLAMGVSRSFADAVMETARSFNEGEAWALEPRSPGNTAPTTLREWAARALSPPG